MWVLCPGEAGCGTSDPVLGLSLPLWSSLCFPLWPGAKVGAAQDRGAWRQLLEQGQEDLGASGCRPPDWSPCPLHPGTPRAHPVLVPALSTAQQGRGLLQPSTTTTVTTAYQGLILPNKAKTMSRF